MLTENEAIGAARERRNERPERRDRTDDRQTRSAPTESGGVEEPGRGMRRPRDESRLSWQPPDGSINLGNAAAAASPTSTDSRGSLRGNAKKHSSPGSRGEKGATSAPSRKPREKRPSKKVPRNFGIPVGWSAEDFDYDDSEDETYTPPLPRNSSSAGGAGAPPTRCYSRRKTA